MAGAAMSKFFETSAEARVRVQARREKEAKNYEKNPAAAELRGIKIASF